MFLRPTRIAVAASQSPNSPIYVATERRLPAMMGDGGGADTGVRLKGWCVDRRASA
jgi:hypothetical protein